MHFALNRAPELGAGISIRGEFLTELSERVIRGDLTPGDRLQWFEVVPENYLGRGGKSRRALLCIAEVFPIALHGVTLSIGSTDPLDLTYLKNLKTFAREMKAPWVSDHLCFSSVNGEEFHNLLPLPFTREAVKHVVKRIKKVQSYFDIPFALENPSYYAVMPGSEMTEAQFMTEIVEQSGCSLLLDINNVYVNAINHFGSARFAYAFLKQIPLDRVIEVHIAGHEKVSVGGESMLLDTHGARVVSGVRKLLRELHSLKQVKNLLLERESNIPPLDVILEEIDFLWRSLSESRVEQRTGRRSGEKADEAVL